MQKWILMAAATLTLFGCSARTAPNPSDVASQTDTPSSPAAVNTDIPPQQEKGTEMPNAQPTDSFGYVFDEFTTPSGKPITLHAIKHGSIRLQFDGLEFEIDPVIDLNGKKTDYASFPKADYILVTHEHFDHLDPAAIKALEKPGTTLITNASCAEKLGNGLVMKNGDARDLTDHIHLEAVPAYNTTAGREKFHPKGRDNGFVLTLDGFKIYIAGDTEDIPEMENLKNIDIAFLPCNQPYTMTPAQLAHAVSMMHPKIIFPYHYGETSMDEVRAALKDSSTDLRIRNYQ